MLEEKNGEGCHLEQRRKSSPVCMGTAGKATGPSTALLSKPGATPACYVEEEGLQIPLAESEK